MDKMPDLYKIYRLQMKGGNDMAKNNVIEAVKELAEPIVTNLNLELVDVEFVKEGSNWYLRIFIDKDGGVEIDDCARVSEIISDKLDEVDPIEQSYFLEVSSPGIERPLKNDKDLEAHIDEIVQIQTYAPISGEKSFLGKLKAFDDNEITLEIKKKTSKIPRDKISIIKTVWQP